MPKSVKYGSLEAEDTKRVLEAVRNGNFGLNAASRKTLCSKSYPEKTFR
jgi:hypothetical protein